jgi:hypothetical protein
MKTIALTLFAAALGIAQNQPNTSSEAAGAAPAAKAAAQTPSKAQDKKPPQAQSIPAGAAQVEPYLYRYTDSSGKTWMYRQTPFGISKWEEASTPAPQPAGKSEPVVVTDLGDSVRFQRKTPFGLGTWVRKKTELNDEEKALLAGSNASSQPSSSVSKPADSQIADKAKEEK